MFILTRQGMLYYNVLFILFSYFEYFKYGLISLLLYFIYSKFILLTLFLQYTYFKYHLFMGGYISYGTILHFVHLCMILHETIYGTNICMHGNPQCG
jgi:hypothetical protein